MDEVAHLGVAHPLLELLAHQHAQILGERSVGIVDRLVLTDETAQLRGDRPRPRFERRIGQHFSWRDRVSDEGEQKEEH